MNARPHSVMQHPALALVGTPYARGGFSPEEGFDCYTLMQYVRHTYFHLKTPGIGIPSPRLPSATAAALAIFRALGGRERVASPWLELARPVDGCAIAL